MNQERKIPGEWSFGRWLLLGAFGIALAVAIALVAGNLADQPVGISGEPVSAGSALEPTSASGGSAVTKPPADSSGSDAGSGGSTSGSSTATIPVTPQTQTAPPVATGSDDYSAGNVQPGGSDDSSGGGEKESGDD